MKTQDKKKILFLITKSSWGGAQRYVFDLATNIDKEKYEPVIALGGTGELYGRLREAGLRVISIRGLGRDISVFKDFISSCHIIYLLYTERPDVLHVNSSKVGGLGSFFGRLFGIKRVIFTSHGWVFNENRPQWQKPIIKFLQWITVLFAHHTIVVSAALKRDLNWFGAQKKMHVLPLGRSLAKIHSREDARGILATKVQHNQVSLNDCKDDLWLGTIAELHPTKCVDVAIRACAALVTTYPTLRYVIIHDGEERERLMALVEQLQLTEHVFFTGTIDEAASLLKAFDVFVLPSRSEAFGYVLVEAGLAEVPVVATNVGGIPEVVEYEKTGLLVPPTDATALQQAVALLLDDATLRQQYATAHHERSQEFTLENMIEGTEAVYENK